MGVINLTPNSFSDASKHLHSDALNATLDHFHNHGVSILDIGAESSAPMNNEVGHKEEWKRLEEFFFASAHLDRLLEFDISLDSFRLETVRAFFSKLSTLNHHGRRIWNDVSGVLEDDVFKIISDFKLEYIYCHNEICTRDSLFDHAKLRGEGDICERVMNDARRVTKIFSAAGLKDQLIFDPCYGFSKSVQENYDLLKGSARIIDSLEVGSLVGISRKSFLRCLVGDRENMPCAELNQHTDTLQSIFLSQLLIEMKDSDHRRELILRLHDPRCFELSKQSQIFLK